MDKRLQESFGTCKTDCKTILSDKQIEPCPTIEDKLPSVIRTFFISRTRCIRNKQMR